MDALLAFITLTLIRIVLPLGALLIIGEWVRRNKSASMNF